MYRQQQQQQQQQHETVSSSDLKATRPLRYCHFFVKLNQGGVPFAARGFSAQSLTMHSD
jgi:hypothetical protein